MTFMELPARMPFTALIGLKDFCRSSDSIVRKLSEVVGIVVDEASIGQLLHEPTRKVVVPQVEEIAPKHAEEPTMTTESMVFREEVPATKQPKLDEQLKMAYQRQTTEPWVEEQASLGQSKVRMTREMVLEEFS